MEIHSSSLSFILANENFRAKKNSQHSSNLKTANSENEITIVALSSRPATISDIETLSSDIKKQQNTSTDLRNSRALNLYIQENTQLLQNQRSDLISRIDFFT